MIILVVLVDEHHTAKVMTSVRGGGNWGMEMMDE